ncbi:MAG: hypothetical protein K9K86_04110, partial [Pseudomonadales bacterium]|nr:hypothetical protein [Pseudomonadales bacterium]
MHRSGTSTVARIINLHGVPLSSNLEPANDYNEKGYWESQDIMAIHDRLLTAANSSWKDCNVFPQSWVKSGQDKIFCTELADVLLKDFGKSPLFLVKDPRICRLMPIWVKVLKTLNAEPAI